MGRMDSIQGEEILKTGINYENDESILNPESNFFN
jgi:hypothetical protein